MNQRAFHWRRAYLRADDDGRSDFALDDGYDAASFGDLLFDLHRASLVNAHDGEIVLGSLRETRDLDPLGQGQLAQMEAKRASSGDEMEKISEERGFIAKMIKELSASLLLSATLREKAGFFRFVVEDICMAKTAF